MTKSFIRNVSLEEGEQSIPEPTFRSTEELLRALKERNVDGVEISGTLKGGVVSQVYAATCGNKKIVIKHTEDVIPFDPTEVYISRAGHNVDTHVLQLLDGSSVRVPKIYNHYPEITTTIMEDMRDSGFTLLSDVIMSGKLEDTYARDIGENLAKLAKLSRTWSTFPVNETALVNIYERGLELRLAYPNSQEQYHELEEQYTANHSSWVWPDGHPKNIFVHPNGNVAFIDFGRSHWGDQNYMLPNFVSHIAMYTVIGKITKEMGIRFIELAINGYESVEKIPNWRFFCMYFGMEILHRMSGKWVTGVERWQDKQRLSELGLRIFDEKVESFERLTNLIKDIA